MCLRYPPTTVACVCIHLACKWSNYKIPLSAHRKEWFTYIDGDVTIELLEKLTEEFLAIFDKCPESRLRKKKIMNSKQGVSLIGILLSLFSLLASPSLSFSLLPFLTLGLRSIWSTWIIVLYALLPISGQRIGRLHASKFFWHLIRISSAVSAIE